MKFQLGFKKAADPCGRFLPQTTLVAFLTILLAIKAIKGGINYNDESKFMPALGANVLVVLLNQFLLGIGYILAKVI